MKEGMSLPLYPDPAQDGHSAESFSGCCAPKAVRQPVTSLRTEPAKMQRYDAEYENKPALDDRLLQH